MPKNELLCEQDMRYMGNVICASGKNLAQLLDMLAQVEITCHTEQPEDEGILHIGDFTFDFFQV